MDQSQRQPGDLFPGLPIDEAELLAYVEGELAEERKREVAALLQARPEVKRLLDAMRRDRLVLAECGDAAAPDGLIDSALSVLERDTLLGPGAAPQEAPAPIPITAHRSRRPLRALAMAAGFLLLVGGASYWISVLVRPPAPQPSPLVVNPSPTPPDTRIAQKTETDTPSPAPDDGAAAATLAQVPTPEPAESTLPDERLAVAAEDATHSEAPAPIFTALTAEYYPVATITPERALQLAREGRLAISANPRCKGRRSPDDVGPVAPAPHLPSTSGLVIDLPATPEAIADLRRTLRGDSEGDVMLEELPEAYLAAGAAEGEDPVSPFWDRIAVPILTDDEDER